MTALRRYLVLGEETSTAWCPDWYATIQASKYLNVAPWQLMDQCIFWREKALISMTAENQAQKILNDKANK